ncbi:MAG: hypothetical protein RJA55_3213 [Acidobacteriota bacterium]|jgi:peptidyl-prolyl cis-trans isomerase A (cyclophilin A)
MVTILLSAAFIVTGLAAQSRVITVVIETSAGVIEVALDPVRAPMTTANFLRYVDAGMYDGGRFHRAVRRDNQARQDVLIEVIQGGAIRRAPRPRAALGPSRSSARR